MAPHRRQFRLLHFLLSLAAVALARATDPVGSVAAQLSTTEQRDLQREARLIVDLLQNLHYSDRTFREIDDGEVITRYTEALDPGGWFISQEERDFLKRRFSRVLKSVYVFKGDVSPAFEIYDLFVRRANERLDWIARRFDAPFDFTADERCNPADWKNPPANRTDADRRWELRLKDELLQEILAGREPQAATVAAKERHERLRRRITGLDALTVRELYLEMLIESFDPHSGYFSSDSAHEFQVGMAGAVSGVGLDLRKQDGRCVVAAITPGSPADHQQDLRGGDTIVATAEGDGPWVPTAGRRLREIVPTVRGQPDTTVRLAFTPAGGTERHELTLTRTRIVLEESRARGAIGTVTAAGSEPARRIGWIELPAFYANNDPTTPSSAAADLRTLIGQMETEGIAGLVLDLRRNPGGAMQEAIAIAGLFLPEGTVLLARGQDGSVAAQNIPPGTPSYRGPLVVLTSAASASASEVLAGALRYHRRAVVVGAPRTFGKGTVQNYIDLSLSPTRGAGATAAWGMLRLTAQRFSSPDGTGPQGFGVEADVALYDLRPDEVPTEAALPHALPAEPLPVPAGVARAEGDFLRLDAATGQQLVARHTDRVAALPELALWAREHQLRRDWQADMPRSLQLEKRQQEQAALEARLAALRQERRALTAGAAYPTVPVDLPEVRAAQESRRLILLSRAPGDTAPGRLAGNVFLAHTPDGQPREVRLGNVDFRQFAGDAPALCAAFAAATGQSADVAEFATLLPELALLPEVNEAAIRGCFLQHFPAERLDSARLELGLVAVLQKLAEIDGELLAERPALDIGLRESLRLAADWAALQTAAAPSPSAKSSP